MTRLLTANPRRRVYRFLLWLTLSWAVSLVVWNSISPWYGQALAAATTIIFHKNPLVDCEVTYRFEKISIIASTYFSLRQWPGGEKVYFEGSPSWDGRRFHFSFTVWVALLLATPFEGRWGKKVLWFLVGWGIIFASQVVGLFLQTVHQNLLFSKTLMASGKYLAPSALELVLGFAGRYCLLIGNIVFPIFVWLFIGVPRLRSAIASTEQGAKEGTIRKAADQNS